MHTDRDLDAILEQSLAQIAAGKARVESCLLAYPAYADELEPLLRMAERMRALPKPVLAPEARARIEAQVLQAAPRGPLFRASRRPVSRPRFVLPKLGWALGALAVVAFMMVVSIGLVQAAAGSLPGMALYPVKLAVEDARLWLAPADREPALHLEFAHRRLAEAEALAEEGRAVAAVLEALVAHMEAALAGAEQLPQEAAAPVLQELIALAEIQADRLPRLAERVPLAEREAFQRALGLSAAHADRARILLGPDAPEPEAGATPTSTATSEPSTPGAPAAGPTATYTPSPTPSLTPSRSPTATQEPVPTATGEPAEPTEAPMSTAEPTQEPVPTSTEEPTAEPTPTKKTPPGLTNTPEPPGQTRTPWPPPEQS
ncbi:MAG: DUF5667 domain-containing protein, partial [Anaerolineae bacterium]